MGLFSYPVLMAADILMFNAHKVPVGRDQIQHLEMTRDIAQRFNHQYGKGQELFVLPEVQIDDEVATLPGLDGRKMSKSYNNTIPLFEGGARALKAAISRIVTDSRAPGEPKDADGSHLYTLYRAFATREVAQAFRVQLEQGLSWGDAKQALCELVEAQIGPMRDTYTELMTRPDRIEEILQAGAVKARALASPLMERVREAVGLRQASAPVQSTPVGAKSGSRARVASFRDAEGCFRQRLFAADGTELLLSEPFKDPKELNRLGRLLGELDLDSLVPDAEGVLDLMIEGQRWARCPADDLPRLRAALAELGRAANS